MPTNKYDFIYERNAENSLTLCLLHSVLDCLWYVAYLHYTGIGGKPMFLVCVVPLFLHGCVGLANGSGTSTLCHEWFFPDTFTYHIGRLLDYLLTLTFQNFVQFLWSAFDVLWYPNFMKTRPSLSSVKNFISYHQWWR